MSAAPAPAAPASVPAGPAAPRRVEDAEHPTTGVDRLVSGEGVELDVRIARPGSRVLALLIDILAQTMLYFVFAAAVPLVWLASGSSADAALVSGLEIVVLVLVLVGYPVAMETITGGRTLGKLALGLRVVRDDGGPITFRHAFTRCLIGVAAEWPGLAMPVLTWIVSIITMMSNRQSKRLGDLAAGTIVIHERTPASWGWVPAMPPPLAQWATLLDLTGLDDDLALAVRHFLARNRQIKEPTRTRLGHALAAEVAACTTPPPPPGAPGWAYLAAVLAERHRRAARRLARSRATTAAVFPELGGRGAAAANALVRAAGGHPAAPPG